MWNALETRATADEWLDGDRFDEDMAVETFRFIAWTNRWLGGEAPLKWFLGQALAEHDSGEPLRILDIGCGDCSLPLAMTRWAVARGRPVEFTCVERSPPVVALARKRLAAEGEVSIRLLHADVCELELETRYDWATAAMVLHHMQPPEIARLVGWLAVNVRQGLFVSDLRRSRWALLWLPLLTCRLSRAAAEDARLSVCKGFRSRELRRLLEAAGAGAATVRCWPFSRISAMLRFSQCGKI